jgi:hypothetical protein
MNKDTRQQNWGDDLRLPTLDRDIAQPLIAEIEPLRRISHPFQSKHLPILKRGSWFALKRPADRSRTGLVCLMPSKQSCVYVSGDRDRIRVALLRLRVDPQFYAAGAGMTVFAATLCAAARQLQFEDVLMWKGTDVGASMTFSRRAALLVQFLDHMCTEDPRLLGGLQLTMASWGPLTDIAGDGVWEFQQDEAGRKRLLWFPNMRSSAAPSTVQSPDAIVHVPAGTVANYVTAVREAGPDQWSLVSATGESLGRALIRTLEVSSGLRSHAIGSKVRVEIVWNADFNKWEVCGL